MKDASALVVAAVVFAAFSWLFWHFLGSDAFSVISMLAVIVLLADNFRLRKSQKNRGEK
jgi:hypothetical protein